MTCNKITPEILRKAADAGAAEKFQACAWEAVWDALGMDIPSALRIVADDLARPVIVAEAAKVLLGDRFAGYGNRKAMEAMWNHVYEMHGRHMLPQSHYDGVLQAALRALSHEGGEWPLPPRAHIGPDNLKHNRPKREMIAGLAFAFKVALDHQIKLTGGGHAGECRGDFVFTRHPDRDCSRLDWFA